MKIAFTILTIIPIICYTQCISGDCTNGYGAYKFSNGHTYTGNWMNGVQHGLGSITYTNGDRKSGEWVNDQMSGKGTYLWTNGDFYTGEWQNNQRTGLGYFVWSDGTKREGKFVNGEFVTAISTIYSKPPFNDPNYYLKLCTETNSSSSNNSGSQIAMKTVKIGTQVWMSENLKTDQFRNGDKIKQAKSIDEFNKLCELGEPAWCFYEFFDFNGEFYGKIYNWYAVIDPRGLAPVGFHISKSDDWEKLKNFLEKAEWYKEENPQYRIPIPGYALKTAGYWIANSGIDKYGFGATPGGYLDRGFMSRNSTINWWCSDTPTVEERSMGNSFYETRTTINHIKFYNMTSIDQMINQNTTSFNPYESANNGSAFRKDKVYKGFYVRCVKD